MLYEKMREHLRRKEDQYSKEVEVKQHLELTFQAVEVIVKTERNNLNQVAPASSRALGEHTGTRTHMALSE